MPRVRALLGSIGVTRRLQTVRAAWQRLTRFSRRSMSSTSAAGRGDTAAAASPSRRRGIGQNVPPPDPGHISTTPVNDSKNMSSPRRQLLGDGSPTEGPERVACAT